MNDSSTMGQISAAAWNQLDAICEGLAERPKPLHAQRIRQQDQGHSLYLLAWKRQRPVGHVILKWPTWPERPLAVEWQARYDCCFIDDLWVDPDSRNEGIGRGLMEAAHSHTSKQAIPSVGLAVGMDPGYEAARRLYRSLGYKDPGHGRFIESGPGWTERLSFLLKELS